MTSPRSAAEGVTLVELIVAGALTLVIGGVVLTLLAGYINLSIVNHDIMTAASRAGMVFLVLERPLHHAGLGLPTSSSADYAGAWGGDGPLVKDWDNDWHDAVYIAADNREIGAVYAVPAGLFVDSGPDDGGRLTLLSQNLPADIVPGGAANLDSWIVAPGTASAYPMEVTANQTGADGTLMIRVPGASGYTLYPHQELHRLKAFRAFVDDSHNFRMVEVTDQSGWNDLEGGGVAIEGIRAVRFLQSADRKTLEIRVLAMGDSKGLGSYETLAAQFRSRWPELGDDPADGSRYVEEFITRLRIRNMEERDDV